VANWGKVQGNGTRDSPTPPSNAPDRTPSTAGPSLPSTPRRISRAGSVSFVAGILLVGFGFLCFAEQYNIFQNGGPFSTTFELWGSAGYVLAGMGGIIAGIGWVFDQLSIAGVAGSTAPPGGPGRSLTGFVLVLLGVALIGFDCFYQAIPGLAAYYHLQYTLTISNISASYVGIFAGFLLVGVGWLLPHLNLIDRIERASS
jgi:hypothetical protein